MRVPFPAATLNRATMFGVSRVLRHFLGGALGGNKARPYSANDAITKHTAVQIRYSICATDHGSSPSETASVPVSHGDVSVGGLREAP